LISFPAGIFTGIYMIFLLINHQLNAFNAFIAVKGFFYFRSFLWRLAACRIKIRKRNNFQNPTIYV